MLVPLQKSKNGEVNIEDIISMIIHAPEHLTSTSSIKVGIMYFGILYIPKLAQLREKLSPEEFEKLVYQYNLSLQKYISRKEHLM